MHPCTVDFTFDISVGKTFPSVKHWEVCKEAAPEIARYAELAVTCFEEKTFTLGFEGFGVQRHNVSTTVAAFPLCRSRSAVN